MPTQKLNDAALLEIAKKVVPEHLRTFGKVVRVKTEPMMAMAGIGGAGGEVDVLKMIAKDLNVEMEAAESAGEASRAAVVEFVEMAPFGQRKVVVNIKDGQVTSVLKNA